MTKLGCQYHRTMEHEEKDCPTVKAWNKLDLKKKVKRSKKNA